MTPQRGPGLETGRPGARCGTVADPRRKPRAGKPGGEVNDLLRGDRGARTAISSRASRLSPGGNARAVPAPSPRAPPIPSTAARAHLRSASPHRGQYGALDGAVGSRPSRSTTIVNGAYEMWMWSQITALVIAFCAVIAPAATSSFLLTVLAVRRPLRLGGRAAAGPPSCSRGPMVEVMTRHPHRADQDRRAGFS
jgi:hypothetical protein